MRWSILIDTEAKNIQQFDDQFYFEGSIRIPNGNIKGIIICDEEDTNDKDK